MKLVHKDPLAAAGCFFSFMAAFAASFLSFIAALGPCPLAASISVKTLAARAASKDECLEEALVLKVP